MNQFLAKKEYAQMCLLHTIPKQINRLKEIATNLVVLPITVYYEINKYARHKNKPEIDLETDSMIYKAATVFSRQSETVSQNLFGNKKPTASEYISCPKKVFQSPFFDALGSFLKEHKKPAGFIQSILNVPLTDTHCLYEELC